MAQNAARFRWRRPILPHLRLSPTAGRDTISQWSGFDIRKTGPRTREANVKSKASLEIDIY